MLTSRLAAAQDALSTLLAARAGLSGVTITVGEPDEILAEHIWLPGDVATWAQSQSTTGNIATAIRQETFSISAVIAVKQTAASFAGVRNRALTLAGEIEGQCRDDHTLSGNVAFAEVKPVEMAEGHSGSERMCVIQVDISCEAWLA